MNPPASDVRLNVRIPKDSDLKQRLTAAADTVRLPESAIVVHAVEAVVKYIERHGKIILPVEVLEHTPAK